MNHFYKAMAQLSHRYWQQYYEDCVREHNKRIQQKANLNEK